MTIQAIDAQDLANLLKSQNIRLIDVREKDEFSDERIAGAQSLPLSTFRPDALGAGSASMTVFYCAGGVRSLRAVTACEAARLDVHTHLKGGLRAWKAAGLPTER